MNIIPVTADEKMAAISSVDHLKKKKHFKDINYLNYCIYFHCPIWGRWNLKILISSFVKLGYLLNVVIDLPNRY